MNTLDAIKKRRSIRKYVPEATVSDTDIKKMLESAMMAPSAGNTRPWEFVVIRDRSLLIEIMKIHPHTRMLNTASCAIVVCGKPKLQKGDCEGFWPEDCGAAIENLLLAATELGFGSCWCGCYPRMDRCDGLKKLLDLNSIPFGIVALGKADEDPAPKGFYDEDRVIWK